MPKKKSYLYQDFSKSATMTATPQNLPLTVPNGEISKRPPADADINLHELLGDDARLTSSARTIVLSRALGQGIDEWVFATTDAIRAELLSGIAQASGLRRRDAMIHFFAYLKSYVGTNIPVISKLHTPADLVPLHIQHFKAWLQKRGQTNSWKHSTIRMVWGTVKSVLLKMFDLGLIKGEAHLFFKRGAFKSVSGVSNHTSFSDAEQERLAVAIKADLSAVHHGRLQITMRELQGLRLLLVAHRMGYNTTQLLELTRDSMTPGLVPGTIKIKTVKHRSRRIMSQAGRAGDIGVLDTSSNDDQNAARLDAFGPAQEHANAPKQALLAFNFAEGGVIQQAIDSTEHLVANAPASIQNRVWLFESSKNTRHDGLKGDVSSLSNGGLTASIKAIVKRHNLVSDDGERLVVNISRLRKSRFDRAFRISDGDLLITANLMGNTPRVTGTYYSSMNYASQAEAARFLNDDYVGMMRFPAERSALSNAAQGSDIKVGGLHRIEITPIDDVQTQTPISGCSDSIGGEHAPKNGSYCDRFVMCLFCSNFAIAGSVDELWRLFSFQYFARAELSYLEERLGPLDIIDGQLEDLVELRERYRLVIPFIDNFTERQFAPSRVAQAKTRTAEGLHPFWQVQMNNTRYAQRGSSSSKSNLDYSNRE